MMTKEPAAAVHVRRTIHSAPERVYRAWLDPQLMAEWFAPAGFTVRKAEVDERVGGTTVEGEAVDKINGLAGVRAEVMMGRTPDGTGKLELVKYHAPADDEGPQPWPANRPG